MNRTKSAQLFERTREVVPCGVASQVRSLMEPHPVYFDHAKGSRLYDVDGNEYIDYLLGYGPMILGYHHQAVIDAMERQLQKGWGWGAPHELLSELAEKLIEVVPCYEMVRFNNSGSEAVHATQRLARAYTGRNKILKFEGHYHGWYDNIYVSHLPEAESMIGLERAPWKVLGSPGQPESVLEDLVVLPWNNLELLAKTLQAQAHEIAAVLMEPIMSNCAVIPPNEGYLEGVRELTREYDVLLIFDEVITGLRVALTSAQGHFGVTPDLSIVAKALWGGFPIVSFGGRRDIMELLARRQVVHAGTFNGGPVRAAAALAVLNELSRDGGVVYEQMTALANKLMQGLADAADSVNIPVRIQGSGGPFFGLSFRDPDKPITNFRDSFDTDAELYTRFRWELLERGVHIFPTDKGLFYFSTAHAEEDIDITIDRAAEAFQAIA